MKTEDFVKLHYKFTQNIPANILEESQIAQNISGIVSQDTQLSVLSIVDNVAKEKEKIEAENEALKQDPVIGELFSNG